MKMITTSVAECMFGAANLERLSPYEGPDGGGGNCMTAERHDIRSVLDCTRAVSHFNSSARLSLITKHLESGRNATGSLPRSRLWWVFGWTSNVSLWIILNMLEWDSTIVVMAFPLRNTHYKRSDLIDRSLRRNLRTFWYLMVYLRLICMHNSWCTALQVCSRAIANDCRQVGFNKHARWASRKRKGRRGCMGVNDVRKYCENCVGLSTLRIRKQYQQLHATTV